MLRRSGIPLPSKAREEDHPLLIAGGPCVMANPEPLADIVDAFAIGEAEVIVPTIVEPLAQLMDLDRGDLLERLTTLPGIYVPRAYQVDEENGRKVGILPRDGAPHLIQRQWLQELDQQPTTSCVITDDTEFGNMYLMEVTRGCGRGCHFCLAGAVYSPVRERSPEILVKTAKKGLAYRQTLGLVGSSLSDYSHIEELVRELRTLGARLSVASLRVDPLPEELLNALSQSGSQTITIAPEAGSERLRKKIRKGISTGDIMRAAELISRYDFPHLKLYFMIGLPTEEDSDVSEIVELLRGVRRRYHRHITANVTPFVPKAQTPFQHVAMASRRVLEARFRDLKKGLRSLNVEATGESPRRSEVQGVFARGDRLVGKTLMALEGGDLSAWRTAVAATGLDTERYLGAHHTDEILPWLTIAGDACLEDASAQMSKQRV
jgi:radical SAM superfamily enzyme YgiQ (UPF0313 family)